ncbi:hypothetical protein D3C87_574020 [compost metagenome]
MLGLLVSFIIWAVITVGIIYLPKKLHKHIKIAIAVLFTMFWWFTPIHAIVAWVWPIALIAFVVAFFYKPLRFK